MRLVRYAIFLLIPLYGVLLLKLWQIDVLSQFQLVSSNNIRQIYSAPIEISTESLISKMQMQKLLSGLGYRQLPNHSLPGLWSDYENSMVVHLRGFDNGLKSEEKRTVKLTFKGPKLTQIRDLERSLTLGSIWLEPTRLAKTRHLKGRVDSVLALEHIPPGLVATLLAVEDRNYLRHAGFDLRGIFRALWQNIKSQKLVAGGSTITQQLVKNHYLSAERTFSRKLLEVLISITLERNIPKHDLLESYINTIFIAQDGQLAIHGFPLGSLYWFNRPLAELNLAELALLVGIIKGPTNYHPVLHKRRALKRRNIVLQSLHETGYIDKEQLQRLKASPSGIVASPGLGVTLNPAYEDLIETELGARSTMPETGSVIHTHLNARIQLQLEKSIENTLKALEQKKNLEPSLLQVAALVFDRKTGSIVAASGDRRAYFPGFNRLKDARRPIGSLIKPFIVYEALEDSRQYTLASRLEDLPIEIKLENGSLWTPSNFDRTFKRQVSIYETLVRSLNVPTVRLGLELGIEKIIKRLEKQGLEMPIKPVPAILLGAISTSPLQVAQIYAPIFNHGYKQPLHTLSHLQKNKNVVRERYEQSQIMRPDVLSIVNYALYHATLTGTAQKAGRALRIPSAGKTGTTDDYRDSWFIGSTGDYVAVIWIGADNNSSINLTGSQGALELWITLMKGINLEKGRHTDYTVDEGIVWLTVGKHNQPGHPDYCESKIRLPFIAESLNPNWVCDE